MAFQFSRIAPVKGHKRTARDYALLALIPVCMVAGCNVASNMDAPANAAAVTAQ
jgi:hypothetical protein